MRFGANLMEEHFHQQMVRRRGARSSVAHLAVFAFHQSDQVRQRRRADVRIGDESKLSRTDEADRREVLHSVIGELPVDRWTNGERGHRSQKQRVAVRRRFRDGARGDQRAGADPVVDDDRALELVLQLGRQQPHQDVGAAAGRERADESNGAAWIFVGLGAGQVAENSKARATMTLSGHPSRRALLRMSVRAGASQPIRASW